MIDESMREDVEWQCLSSIDSMIDSLKRLQKNIKAGKSAGFGETLQNTWRLYHFMGQLHILDLIKEEENKHE